MRTNAITIVNEGSSAVIDVDAGGLLSKLAFTVAKGKRIDVLYQPGSGKTTHTTWGHGGMPILFPFAGRVQDGPTQGQYRVGENTFPMPPHGFAARLPWEVKALERSNALVSLSSSKQTKQHYPFDFEMEVSYQLGNSALQMEIRVKNTDDRPLPIAPGLHPYFCARPEASVVVKHEETIEVTNKGLAGERTKNTKDSFKIKDEKYHNLILGGVSSKTCTIAGFQKGVDLEISSSEDFQNIVLWTNDLKSYYCVEPWVSLPDAPNHGVIEVARDEIRSFKVTIAIA
ncbi:MAG: hypothetical protein AB7T49_01370 [Oligoflexales bacterium]